MKSQLKLIIALMILLLSYNQTTLAKETEHEKVESVEVQLNIAGKIYEGLQERMEFSIGRVGEKLLLSQSIPVLKESKKTVENAIFNVFSKVLVGFKLDSIDLRPGRHTVIIVHLDTVAPLINQVQLNVDAPNVAPEIQELTLEISNQIEQDLNQFLSGLPVASLTWSEGIVNLVVDYLLQKGFPGFTSKFVIKPGPSAILNVTLTPMEPIVEKVIVKYSSKNLPVWLVKNRARKYQDKLEILKGIPVEFLIHYQSKLEKLITKYLSNLPKLKKTNTFITVTPGAETIVRLNMDSRNYQTSLEGRYFISEEESFRNLRGYFGYTTDDYEVYTSCYWGNNPGGRYQIGLGWPISTNFKGGFEYEFEQNYQNIWLHNQFDRGDYFHFKIGIDDSPNEALIGIYLNDHANLELVKYDNSVGIQLMFHF